MWFDGFTWFGLCLISWKKTPTQTSFTSLGRFIGGFFSSRLISYAHRRLGRTDCCEFLRERFMVWQHTRTHFLESRRNLSKWQLWFFSMTKHAAEYLWSFQKVVLCLCGHSLSFICSVSITGRRNLRKQYHTQIALKQGLSNWDFVTTARHFTWWLYSSHERRKNFTCSGENKFTRDGYSKQMCSLEKLHFYINARMVSPADVRTLMWRVCVHIYIMHYAVMRLTYV